MLFESMDFDIVLLYLFAFHPYASTEMFMHQRSGLDFQRMVQLQHGYKHKHRSDKDWKTVGLCWYTGVLIPLKLQPG